MIGSLRSPLPGAALRNMPTTEDDFGRPSPRMSLKGPGAFPPRDCIGSLIVDVQPEPAVRPREYDVARSSLATGSVYCTEAPADRRLKRSVYDGEGKVISCQRPTSESRPRPQGIRQVAHVPSSQKGPLDGSKRCFDWTQRPTGFENPEQWEEPPGTTMRPSHPVCQNGVVALDHRRGFAALQYQETGIPPPKMCKAPHGSEWGGWARNGAPGRQPLQGPWDSLEAKSGGVEAESRFCDARTRRFPEMKDSDTRHLTRWHFDAQRDVDPRSSKKQHLNSPAIPGPGNGSSRTMLGVGMATVRHAAAGRPSGCAVEGTALPWYERLRGAEIPAPYSAR